MYWCGVLFWCGVHPRILVLQPRFQIVTKIQGQLVSIQSLFSQAPHANAFKTFGNFRFDCAYRSWIFLFDFLQNIVFTVVFILVFSAADCAVSVIAERKLRRSSSRSSLSAAASVRQLHGRPVDGADLEHLSAPHRRRHQLFRLLLVLLRPRRRPRRLQRVLPRQQLRLPRLLLRHRRRLLHFPRFLRRASRPDRQSS